MLDAEGNEIPKEGTPEYWAYMGRDRENPTLGMTPDELFYYRYPQMVSTQEDHSGDIQFWQPGQSGYNKPDYEWAKTQSPSQLAAAGYFLSPGQRAALTNEEEGKYVALLASQNSPELGVSMGYDPRIPGGKNILEDWGGDSGEIFGAEFNRRLTHDPNSFGSILTSLAKSALQSAVIGGFTGVGLDLLGGAGVPLPDIPSVPNIPGLGGTGGLESGLFPSTTIPPTGLESGLFPYTTPGAGLGTVPAWGVGGSTIPGLGGSNLGSNLGSSLLPNVNDAYSLYKKGKTALGVVGALTGGNQNTGGNLGGGTQKQQSSQPDWAKLFSAAAFATPLPKQEFITDEVSTVKAPEQVSEMWQGLTPEQTNIIGMKAGGSVKMVPGPENREYARHAKRGFHVKGIGTGQSDEIPTMLAKDEYVIDSDTVSALGDGSSEAGAAVLDKMREEIRKHKRSAPIDKIPPQAKSPLEYMRRKA